MILSITQSFTKVGGDVTPIFHTKLRIAIAHCILTIEKFFKKYYPECYFSEGMFLDFHTIFSDIRIPLPTTQVGIDVKKIFKKLIFMRFSNEKFELQYHYILMIKLLLKI